MWYDSKYRTPERMHVLRRSESGVEPPHSQTARFLGAAGDKDMNSAALVSSSLRAKRSNLPTLDEHTKYRDCFASLTITDLVLTTGAVLW